MKAGGLWHIFYRLAAYNSLGFAVCRFRAPHIASAIHLIWDPLAQHREEPLVRRRKELAVIKASFTIPLFVLLVVCILTVVSQRRGVGLMLLAAGGFFLLAFPPDELFSALAGAIDNRYFSARFAELALFLRQRSIRGDLQIRLQCYLYSLRSFAAHPLGIGPWYSYVVGDRGIGYHSAILDDMARYGLAALAFYGVFLAKYYRMLREQWARIGLRAAAAVITAGWALLLLLNIAFRAADESIFMLYILPVLPDILLQSRKKTE